MEDVTLALDDEKSPKARKVGNKQDPRCSCQDQSALHIVQKYNVLNQPVVQLTHVISILQDKITKMESNEERFVTNQAKSLQCTYCGDVFNINWKIELHLRSHEESEKFQCDICKKTFQAEWRMKKHNSNHYRKNIKKCKFFQNGQFCPFQEVGCKFSHNCVAPKQINENNVEEKSHTKINVDPTNPMIQKDHHEESLEDLMRKAKSFKAEFDSEDDDLENDETIEEIMAKARAFQLEDVSESESLIIPGR